MTPMSAAVPASVAAPAAATAADADVVFREVQRRPHSWMRWTWFGVYLATILTGWGFNHAGERALLPRLIFDLLLVGGLGFMILSRETMVTEVRDGTLHVSFRRGFRRSVPLSAIRS